MFYEYQAWLKAQFCTQWDKDLDSRMIARDNKQTKCREVRIKRLLQNY